MNVREKIEETFPLVVEPVRRSSNRDPTGGFYIHGRDSKANLILYVGSRGDDDYRDFADWIVRTLEEAAARELHAGAAWASPAEAIDFDGRASE